MVVFEWFFNWLRNIFKSENSDTIVLPDHTTRAHEIAPWMAIARNELGQLEEIDGKDNPRVIEYGKSVELEIDDSSTPWCATFVNYVLIKAGYKGSKSAVARSFIHWGREIEGPVYGCITVFSRGSSSWKGHVGFFVGHQGDNLLILGGNQDNSVSIKPYKKSKVLAYRMPE